MPDLYSVLGVQKSASQQQIKKAYRKLASELHPDKNPGAAGEQRFKDVTSAYEVLGDDNKRRLYDEFGDVSLRAGFDEQQARAAQHFGGFPGGGGGQGGVHFDLDDILGGRGGGGFGDMLGDLFSGRRGSPNASRGQRRAARGYDTTSSVRIGFADAVLGTTLKLAPSDGSEPVTVRIPAGAADGSKVRVRGKGGPGMAGGPAGDLLLTIEVEAHPHFERDGDDLWLDLPIALGEAYSGAQVMVPTPHGDVKLTIPARVQSGKQMRLRGKGVHRKNKPPGDLYVRLQVVYPDRDDIADAVASISANADDPRGDIRF